MTSFSAASSIDCAYRPLSDGREWLAEFSPTTALVVGRDSDEIAGWIGEAGILDARLTHDLRPLRRLRDGIYVVYASGSWHTLWVQGGKAPGPAETGRTDFIDNHLGEAWYTYEDEWASALPLLGDSPMREGDVVAVRGQSGWGRITSIRRHDSGHDASVDLAGRLENFDIEDLELLKGDLRDPHFWVTQPPCEATDIARTLSWIKLANPLDDTLYSYAATKTIFKPYQFIPVLKMLHSPTGRLLIADEVGLGKTIEAGLIWTELEQRAPLRRALVIVPAALRIKWRFEMDRRFMRQLPELSKGDIAGFLEDIHAGKDPELVGVISLERLRSSPDLLAQFTELSPHLDLVILDEAHSLRNKSSRSYDVGRAIADLADHVVFLSATPLNLGTDDLFNLVNLLDPGTFPDSRVFQDQLVPNRHLNAVTRLIADPTVRSHEGALRELDLLQSTSEGAAVAQRPSFERLRELLERKDTSADDVARVKRYANELNTLGSVFTRTRKVDVPESKAIREVEEVLVRWSEQERKLYDSIYQVSMRRALISGVPLGFAMQMPLRQACSSLIVAQRRQLDRNGWDLESADELATEQSVNLEAELSAEFDFGSELEDAVIRIRLDHDTKLDALRARLRKARANGMNQALIFSFFRGTVGYLAEMLGAEFRTEVLHGGIPFDERQEVIDRFRAGEFDLLIANQVGSEGLDFEFCNVLVNYDLPWNPMQVEQRIGRLDRFGQTHSKIHIFNMKTPGTIESDIFGRLYTRIGVFENSIGDLEPIMRGGLDELNKTILDPRLRDAQKVEAVDRFEVATALERDRVKAIEDENGLISTRMLEIDGLNDDGPTNGRYIGAAELRMLLNFVVTVKGGQLRATNDPALVEVLGTSALAVALSAYSRNPSGTTNGVSAMLGQLRDQRAVVVCFDPHHPQVARYELITARHPLIRVAVEQLNNHADSVSRYGRVAVVGLDPSKKYLMSVDIVRTKGGLHDRQELWITAAELESGALVNDASDTVMTALARGQLTSTQITVPSDQVDQRLCTVESAVHARRRTEQTERTRENEALVAGRIVSEKRSQQIKIERSQSKLESVQARGYSSQIVRMAEGELRNHKFRMDEIEQRLEQKRTIVLSVEHVAVLLAIGTNDIQEKAL